MAEQNAANDDRSNRYPYLVVRFMPTVYHSERIQITVGSPAVEFVGRRCIVHHPAPFTTDGSVSPDCRALMTPAVQAEVRTKRLRMCIVWAANSCTYCEADSVSEYAHPPSGGVQLVPKAGEPERFTMVSIATKPEGQTQQSSKAPIFDPTLFSAEAREEITSHLRVVLDQIHQCQDRLPALLCQGANIQALAAQANAYAQDRTMPIFEQVREWAEVLHLAADVAAECADRLFICQGWTEGRLKKLGEIPQ